MNWVWPMAPAHEPFICGEADIAMLEDLERGDELVPGEGRLGL